MTPEEFNRRKLRDAWRGLIGLPPVVDPEPQKLTALKLLHESEWSPEFESHMRYRLVMGAFRYGPLNAPNKPDWDRMASIKKRAELYEQTGDLQLLADIANLSLLEYEEGNHPNKHFGAGDGDEHVQAKQRLLK